MPKFKHETYERHDEKLLRAYLDNMTTFLTNKYGQTHSPEQIEAFVKKQVESNLKRPQARVLIHPEPGSIDDTQMDLLSYTQWARKDQIIAPSGSTYMRPTTKPSLFKQKITEDMAARGREKKKMMKAKAVGDMVAADTANFNQSSLKITANSFPGAFGSEYNILFDVAGYIAVTSSGRYCVIVGYSYVERMFEANLYLPNMDSALNYITLYSKHFDKEAVKTVMEKRKMHVPSVDEVYMYFFESLKKYMIVTPEHKQRLISHLSNLTALQRSYVFYAGCLKHLVMCNDVIFRGPLQNAYNPNIATDPAVKAEDLFAIDGNIVSCATVMFAKELGKNQVYDTPAKDPETARKIATSAKLIESTIEDHFADIFEAFMRPKICTHDFMSHPNMVRKCVIVSDTDSVIFTAWTWVKWYLGELRFTDDAYHIVSFITYVMTKVFEHAFAQMSANMGMVGDDIYQVQMKNEFLYPVMIRTPMAKHYAGLMTVQEGVVLPKAVYDIKGKNLRGSDIPTYTANKVDKFLKDLITSIRNKEPMSGGRLIRDIVEFECMVRKDLKSGGKTFLPNVPVKKREEYKNDPDQTTYFYYELWEEVFAPKYGSIEVPNKVFEVPVYGEGDFIRSTAYRNWLKAKDPEIARRLDGFIEKWPKKNITRVIIPQGIPMPEEVLQVMDVRKLTYKNVAPFYLIMQSFGVVIADRHGGVDNLFSDMYMPEEPIPYFSAA